jgi:hypothetical protein
MKMTLQERNQLSRRIVYFYHRVLTDIRWWLYEEKYDIAWDAADTFEAMTLDFFHDWNNYDKEEVMCEIHKTIDSFFKRHKMQYFYYEIFDLNYEDFVRRFLPQHKEHYFETDSALITE